MSLVVSWDGVPEAASLRLIAAGRPRDTLPIAAAGTREWSVSGNAAARCYVVEVRARDDAMLALTNPIFFE